MSTPMVSKRATELFGQLQLPGDPMELVGLPIRVTFANKLGGSRRSTMLGYMISGVMVVEGDYDGEDVTEIHLSLGSPSTGALWYSSVDCGWTVEIAGIRNLVLNSIEVQDPDYSYRTITLMLPTGSSER